ncbi:hypothetical protein [Streptomyces yatensis]|uniref:Transcriptional regulator n=1 Tax=Streptomyces yatensis TaxID=155177 RepID=A0ABP4UMX1_9ACTN|nr:hypothetical protein [Streptomyces yatensis]
MPDYARGRASAVLPAKTNRPETCQQRLAHLLRDKVPGARTIRVTQHQPDRTWPSPHARAYDAQGNLLPLTRTLRMTAARWVMRTYPGLDWNEPHDLDLVTGELRPTAEQHAVAAGRC